MYQGKKRPNKQKWKTIEYKERVKVNRKVSINSYSPLRGM